MSDLQLPRDIQHNIHSRGSAAAWSPYSLCIPEMKQIPQQALMVPEPGFLLTKYNPENSSSWYKNNIGVSQLVKYCVKDLKDALWFGFGSYQGLESGSAKLSKESL